MSESVRDTASTESLCTVIENSTDYNEHKRSSTSHGENDDTDEATDPHSDHSESQANEISATNDDLNTSNIAHCVSNNINNNNNNHNNHNNNNNSNINSNKPEKPATKPRSKWKKSVSFDPNDEKIQKFITGDPIVDQQNPFRHSFSSATSANGSLAPKPKKIPPPVPTKRSTLSIRKTVTQQLREREREKEKERERIKNEANSRKSISNSRAGAGPLLPSPDDFVTTEEVLKQSKYVKTYIKNPDPYFVYDPTVLARIKFDELREIADKKPPKKLKLSTQTRERLKDLKNKPPGETVAAFKPKELAFKKCSKPNYPELADIKVKVGTTPDDDYFNLAEVTKNAKKFDERVKKLHIGSDDDLDELDEPLTKSESSDEITVNANSHSEVPPPQPQHNDQSDHMRRVMNGMGVGEQRVDGTFTNTINSEEFQQYLEQKGLTLLPKKIPNGAQCVYSGSNGVAGPLNYNQISFKSPETVKISADSMDASRNAKKPSVFQRLLANSIFASRRRTMPKETVPMPRSLYEMNAKLKEKGGSVHSPTQIKRVVLERQSFHGRSRAGNLLSAIEVKDLKNQTERTRKSFASGDDLSLSISSALTNAEYANEPELRQSNISTAPGVRRTDLQPKPIAKPPRRTLSRDRLSSTQNSLRHADHEVLPNPKGQRVQAPAAQYSLSRDSSQRNGDASSGPGYRAQFRRTLERQSLIPKRTTEVLNDKRQVFGRSASMDRNEILKRTVSRGLQNRSKSATGTLKVLANSANSNENLRQQFGPQMTSTPIRDTVAAVHTMEQRTFLPIASGAATKPPDAVYVDQLEWDRLRAMKERTDRELYYKVLQQQQQQQQLLQKKQQRLDDENIYEHLPPNQVLVPHKAPVQRHTQVLAEGNFIRSAPQRNTFSGVLRNRQAKIIDGRAVLADEQSQLLRPQAIGYSNPSMVAEQNASARSQSVLDGMTLASKGGLRRGYDSDNDTPVVLRRKNAPEESTPQRRIGGILTRDEILQKVKEFCRKSLNKTPTINQAPQMQAIYERQPAAGTDLSPVSYASVETHQRPVSRMYAAPQVPQRMHSLPQQFIPIGHESLTAASSGNAAAASPIYAHVVKRSSMQSNQSELYESPPRAYYHVARARLDSSADAQQSAAVYVTREGALLQRPESAFATTQYVIVDGDKLAPAEIVHYHQGDLYVQPQYVRPHQLQRALLPGQYGYITVRESLPQQQVQLQPQQSQQQQMRQRPHDGRSTPLVLDGSSQLASQIYWTPQHQRLQQHAGLLPVQISPRYMFTQPYPVPTTAPIAALRMDTTNSATNLNATHGANIPNGATMRHALISKNQLQKQMMPASPPAPCATTAATSADYSSYGGVQPPFEWESGSEAGEVQRIMERANSGEWKTTSILRNLMTRMSDLMRTSRRY